MTTPTTTHADLEASPDHDLASAHAVASTKLASECTPDVISRVHAVFTPGALVSTTRIRAAGISELDFFAWSAQGWLVLRRTSLTAVVS